MIVHRFRILACAAVLGGAALGAATASAQPVPAQPGAPSRAPVTDKPHWKELTPPQQLALEPLRAEWDRLDGARKQKWLEIANRYSSMNTDMQQRVQERMRDWLKLTPEERRVVRENYTLSKKIDKSQKSAQWEEYQALPDEEKRKLAAEAALKKQVTNLPPTGQLKAIAPIKPGNAKPVACASGLVKNTNPTGPVCIPSAMPAPVAVPSPAAAAASLPAVTTPLSPAPAAPAPNVK